MASQTFSAGRLRRGQSESLHPYTGSEASLRVHAPVRTNVLFCTDDEMASAYLYGICRSHPFMDGNKRAAVAAALTFLRMNGIRIRASEDDFYDLVIGVAEGRVAKAAVAVFLQQHAV
jgi:hypothetical protein